MIGAIGGLNQISLRKLIAYSSINNSGWILASLYNNNLLWIIYFIFYSFLTFSIIFIFNSFKISYINQLFALFFSNKNLKFLFILNLLSLGGLPPFLGFYPKLIVIQLLSINNQLILLLFIRLISLITLYFYIRLCYRIFLLNYYENNWLNFSIYKSFNVNIFIYYSFFSSFGLFLIFSLYL